MPMDTAESLTMRNRNTQDELVSATSGVQQSGRIACVIGSNGGVGTTTTAVNLAASLVEINRSLSVVLTDINVPFGDVSVFLNLESDPTWKSKWLSVAGNISGMESALLSSILYRHPLGFSILPSPEALMGAAKVTPKTMEKILTSMRNSFDVVVVDGDHSYDDISLKILELADTVFLVSTLSVSSLTNVKRLFQKFVGLPFPIREKVKVIINRHQKNSPVSFDDVEDIIGKSIFWQIPNDFSTAISAINQGKTLSQAGSRTELCKSFRELASRFLKSCQVAATG